ncbi:hydantoinase B/oxoprolinase family protein [Paracoccus sp. J56]|uniref:hydantoinase B/oxoprolinase family protein n=1 Tax=Paracoccus sp. J56 TaxID=935850 RepID=UPI00300CFE47
MDPARSGHPDLSRQPDPGDEIGGALFLGDIHEGDLIQHNDPAYEGSHIIGTCMYYLGFHEGELVFWPVCKGHLTDVGGPFPQAATPTRPGSLPKGCVSPRSSSWIAAREGAVPGPAHQAITIITQSEQTGSFSHGWIFG